MGVPNKLVILRIIFHVAWLNDDTFTNTINNCTKATQDALKSWLQFEGEESFNSASPATDTFYFRVDQFTDITLHDLWLKCEVAYPRSTGIISFLANNLVYLCIVAFI